MNWRDLLPFGRKNGTLALFRDLYAPRSTSSGRAVNSTSAIEVSTVFACCRVIGEGLAQVPLKLMRETGNTRQPAKDHPLYDLLSSRPNAWQTSFEFRETLAWHLALTGNAFVFINRVFGKIRELIPVEPGRVKVNRAEDGTLSYDIRNDNGQVQTFPAPAIWHVKGASWNGWIGLEPVKLAREAIGLAMATEEATGSLHKNGVRPSGVYSVEGTLKDDQYKALSKWINDNLAGASNAGSAMILDRSAKWINTQMSGVDAQSLETRKYQVEEICRFFRVMPIMVGYSDKAATYASAEQQFLAHVVHTLAPWYQRIEQSIDACLLTPKERASGLYACFVEEGLLRGSLADTKDYLLGLVNGGLMTPNEGRAKLDLNPDGDPDSDRLRIPANIVGDAPDPMADTKKAMDDLRAEIKTAQPRHPDVNVTINQEPAVIPKAPDVTVNVPAAQISLPEIKAGDVNVNIEPAQINLPEQKAPEVSVHVEPPVTHLEATLPPLTVIASLPARKTSTDIVRDKDGNIVKATQIETDA